MNALLRPTLPAASPSLRPPSDAFACETVMARHAHSFHFAARFLPADVRESVVILYAFCRYVDDLVDEAQSPSDRFEARRELQQWRAWLKSAAQRCPEPALGSPLQEVLDQCCVPRRHLLDLLDGVESDLGPVHIQSFRELRHYCHQVAATVGLCMAHVLGACSPQALAAAEELGIAMQLTNILRDVGADLAIGRMYLPQDELAVFQCDADHIVRLADAGRGPDRHFRSLMRFQVERAYFQYERGLEGVPLLPRDVRLSILTAALLYRGILDVIESRRYDVLRQRATTSSLAKGRHALMAAATVKVWELGERIGVPVFAAVSEQQV